MLKRTIKFVLRMKRREYLQDLRTIMIKNIVPEKCFFLFRPETLKYLLDQTDTIRNNMKHFPELDIAGFRNCQMKAIKELDKSFSENRPRALVQMATGAGKHLQP